MPLRLHISVGWSIPDFPLFVSHGMAGLRMLSMGRSAVEVLSLSSVDSQLELWSDAYGWTNFQLLLKLGMWGHPTLGPSLIIELQTSVLIKRTTLFMPFATEGKAAETSGAPSVFKDMDSSLGSSSTGRDDVRQDKRKNTWTQMYNIQLVFK